MPAKKKTPPSEEPEPQEKKPRTTRRTTRTTKPKTTAPKKSAPKKQEPPKEQPMTEELPVPAEIVPPEDAQKILDAAIEKAGQDNTLVITPQSDLMTNVRTWVEIIEFIRTALVYEIDYGVIPGTDKATLYKAGAERLARYFGFTVVIDVADKELDWTGEHHGGEPLFFYEHRCQIFLGNRLVASSLGSANSWEVKHRYRLQELTCPECGVEAIKRSKFPPKNNPNGTPGWYCYGKIGGCGFNFAHDDIRITGQERGKRINPDPADLLNTIDKMSQKRAFVGAVILSTGTGGVFTQDIEDYYAAMPVPADYSPVPSQLIPKAAKATAKPAQQTPPPQAQQAPTTKTTPPPQNATAKQSAPPQQQASYISHSLQVVMDTARVDVGAAVSIANQIGIHSALSDEEIEKAVKDYIATQPQQP